MRERREKENQKGKRNEVEEGKVERVEKQYGGEGNEEGQRQEGGECPQELFLWRRAADPRQDN